MANIPEIEVTPEMIEAGLSRFLELEGQVGSVYLVEQVFLAMARSQAVSHPVHELLPPSQSESTSTD